MEQEVAELLTIGERVEKGEGAEAVSLSAYSRLSSGAVVPNY